ncbi:hypothetical protein BaRGS_00032161 [Batillaria attramentaria]|uniref:BTB domain-containing protein n=1 Tax=Batillaria attramentaria TaxID=370345 RepID=A0ABD0JNK8_9CAEN
MDQLTNISQERNRAITEGIGRLYLDRMFFDLKVVISGSTFECHRAVLAAVSEFFMSSLACMWQEGASRVVHINHEDVTVESFNLLLGVLYDNAKLTEENAKQLLKTATYLHIPFLETTCIRLLGFKPRPECSLGIMQLAERYGYFKLYKRVLSRAVDHFETVVNGEEFLDLPKAMLLVFLAEYTQLRKSAAALVFQAVVRWVGADTPSRLLHIGELLQFVSFTGFWCMELTQTLYPKIKGGSIFLRYLTDYWTMEVSDCRLRPVTFAGITDDELRTDFIRSHCAVCHGPQGDKHQRSTVKCVVLVGGCTNVRTLSPMSKVSAFSLEVKQLRKTFDADSDAEIEITTDGSEREIEDEDFDQSWDQREETLLPKVGVSGPLFSLKPLPDNCGFYFASCVCDNRLYVSGGSANPRFFAVYSPKKNSWDTLPSLPQDREKHVMVAVPWNIYLLGGWDAKGDVQDTLVYRIKRKKWTNWGQFEVTGAHITAAALGHRIYIFCGSKVDGTGQEASTSAGSEVASAVKTQESLGQRECTGMPAAASCRVSWLKRTVQWMVMLAEQCQQVTSLLKQMDALLRETVHPKHPRNLQHRLMTRNRTEMRKKTQRLDVTMYVKSCAWTR